jgi:hypothetical protein
MDIRIAVSLIDPTASIFEYDGLFSVRGIFANGTDSHDTAPWQTGEFKSPIDAWHGAALLLEARNSGRFN